MHPTWPGPVLGPGGCNGRPKPRGRGLRRGGGPVGVGAGSLQPFRRGKLTRALAGLAHLAFTGAFCGLASPAGTGAGARFVSPDRCCWHPAAMESFDQYDRRCAWWRPRRLSCGTLAHAPRCWPTATGLRHASRAARRRTKLFWRLAQAKFLWRDCGGKRPAAGLAAIPQVFGRIGCDHRRGLVRCSHGAHARGCGQENCSR